MGRRRLRRIRYGKDLGYCSNRKEIKDHGDKGILLGTPIEEGSRVLIIEDVTTAGTSIAETMPILEGLGAKCIGLCVSVDRQERGKGSKSALAEIEEEYGMKTASIVTMSDVTEYLGQNAVDGKMVLDDALKKAISDYYAQYGV